MRVRILIASLLAGLALQTHGAEKATFKKGFDVEDVFGGPHLMFYGEPQAKTGVIAELFTKDGGATLTKDGKVTLRNLTQAQAVETAWQVMMKHGRSDTGDADRLQELSAAVDKYVRAIEKAKKHPPAPVLGGFYNWYTPTNTLTNVVTSNASKILPQTNASSFDETTRPTQAPLMLRGVVYGTGLVLATLIGWVLGLRGCPRCQARKDAAQL